MSWGPSSHPIIACAGCGEYVKTDDLYAFVEPEHLMGGMWAPNAWAVTTRYEHLKCMGVTYVKEIRSEVPDAPDA